MNTDILFQNLFENPAFNTPVAEKTINEIKILDLRYMEAIDITLNEHGVLNKKRLFELLGEDWEEITKDYIFELSDAPGEFETREKYLSGNVKQKLAQAQAAADLNDRFKPNVTMLESVIPRDIPSSLITMNLGARWIPEEEYTSFFSGIS